MSNIPNETKDSQAPVKEFFDNYFNETLTFPGADVDAVVGYFESRGFDKTSSISTASVILQQAKIDQPINLNRQSPILKKTQPQSILKIRYSFLAHTMIT